MSIRSLTGIKPTGDVHLGNYLGAIRPAIQKQESTDVECFYFIADYHALIGVHDPKELSHSVHSVAAAWLACGLDPEKTLIYRQSDIKEIFELTWILNCFTQKGLLNRAHAYKAKVQVNEEERQKDPDHGVSMGLYSYPVLMAADIMAFDAHQVPVGQDQVQHIEMARDMANRIHHRYGELMTLPEAVVGKSVGVIPGLDGRKMSKSYGNVIPLFETEKRLRKLINKMKTDSTPPDAPKDPAESDIYKLYEHFASQAECAALRERYAQGISWGEAKAELFEVVNRELAGPRERYHDWMSHPERIDEVLAQGATKASEIAKGVVSRVRKGIGINGVPL